MRRAICLTALLTTVLLSLGGCDLLNTLDGGGAEPQDTRWVALSATYEEDHPDPDSAYSNRIVLVDFDDPSNYEIITDEGVTSYFDPRFSLDKSKLLFRDCTTCSLDRGPQFVTYNLETDSLHPHFYPSGSPLTGVGGRWNADGTGFYANRSGGALYYPLGDKEEGQSLTGFRVVDVKDDGATIVYNFRKDPPACPDACLFDPFYTMDMSGNYLKHIRNPHLALGAKDGIAYLGRAIDLAWNDDLERFAFASGDSTSAGYYKITVTNLDGSYYREYTSGEYVDTRPRWGPNGKYVLFNRRKTPNDDHLQAMIVNLETGEVRSFVKPEVIGAVYAQSPDY